MKSPKYIALKKLYNETLRILHDYNHPVVQALRGELEGELIYCYRREVYLKRFKGGIYAVQPIKFKVGNRGC